MRYRWRILVAVVVGLGLGMLEGGCDLCLGAGIRDLADGWLLGPGATMGLLGGPVAMTGGTDSDGSAWVLLGQGQLYGLAELPLAAVTVGVGFGRAWLPTVRLDWQSLGSGIYRENGQRLHLQWGQRLKLGGELHYMRVTTGGRGAIPSREEVFGRLSLTVGLGWRWPAGAGLQMRLNLPVAEAKAFRERQGRRRLLAVQGWRGVQGLALTVDTKVDLTLTLSGEWLLSWGGAGLGMRVEPSVGALGPILAWRRGRLLVRTSHLAHPQLGVTHRFEVGFGLGGGTWW